MNEAQISSRWAKQTPGFYDKWSIYLLGKTLARLGLLSLKDLNE